MMKPLPRDPRSAAARRRFAVAAVLLAVAIAVSAGAAFSARSDSPAPGSATATATPAAKPASQPQTPYSLDKRVRWTRSQVVGSPEPPLPYRASRTFANFEIKQPLQLEREPGTKDYILLQHTGGWSGPSQIHRLAGDPNVSKSKQLLELNQLVYSICLDPDYKNNGYLYVFGNGSDDRPARVRGNKGGGRKNRIARFTIARTDPYEIDKASEHVIIEWPSGGHDGGGIGFGKDGLLYLSSGDGSADSDTNSTGQSIDDLNGGILRIDVRRSQNGKPYAIPPDNPYLKTPDACPELYAIGLRNPWRLTFDQKTGMLWVGSNGQDVWESVYVIEKGANYGWPIQEGAHPFHVERKAGPGPIKPATIDHNHSEFRSLTGGVVYHGKNVPDLQGAYIYGDHSTGEIWGARHDGSKLTWHQRLLDTNFRISGFAETWDGDMVVLDHEGGKFYKLEPNPAAKNPEASKFPTRLSASGIFADTAKHELDPAFIPYSVNAEQWVDGAIQERWVGLPDKDVTIDFPPPSGQGWNLPEGTVIVKTLSLEMERGNPQSRRRIETQMLFRQDDGEWASYSYAWNDAQTDAELIPMLGQDRLLTIQDSQAPGGKAEQTWRFSSRTECLGCHSRAANYLLGLNDLQFNRDRDYGAGVVLNQFQALEKLGLLKIGNRKPADLRHLVDPHDASKPLNDRARSYLHANCAICHTDAGGGNAAIELTYRTELDRTKLVAGVPLHDKFGIDDAKLVEPGAPNRSVLVYRMSSVGGGRMPRAGSNVVDEAGLKLIREWVVSLKPSSSATPRADASAIQDLAQAGAKSEAAVDSLLSNTPGAMALLNAIDDGRIDPAARKRAIAKGAAHASGAIRDLFERFVPVSQRSKRLGNSIEPEMILAYKGDPVNGKRLFMGAEGVQCMTCHKIGDGEEGVGPNLGKIAATRDRAALLESLLQPSKLIEEKFRTHAAVTVDGKVYSGIVVAQGPNEVVLKDSQSKEIRISRADLEEIKPSPISLMPEGLLKGLTPGQAADLLEFLTTLR